MKMNKNELDLLRPLIYDLIRRETDPGEIHVCPICNGVLHVSITVYKETGREKELNVGAHCENCETTGFFRFYEKHIPVWAKESKYKDMSPGDALKLLRKDSEEE